MSFNEVLTHLLELVAGVGIFLVACEMMSENLESLSSNKLKKLFASVSNNKLIGVTMGAVATAAIQSSSATTVMVIGFVNAGIISLHQAATIIFGGEIGTTITGQIVALGLVDTSGSIDITTFFAALAGIGVFVNMAAKSEKAKRIGDILSGFGMIFVGLSMMSGAMDSFAKLDALKVFLSSVNNIVLIIVIGAVVTAIIQSSSAMTSIAITMVVTGLISLEQGIYITLGANVGTCITGMMASMGSSANARRTSLIQLIFNIGGVVIMAIIDILTKLVTRNTVSSAILLANAFPGMPQTQLAMFHTIFNIASVVVALPFSNALVNLAVKLVEDDKAVDEKRFHYVDELMLKTPSIAVQQVKKEIVNMAKIAIDNFNIAIGIIKTHDYTDVELFRTNEEELNYLNRNLVDLVVKLSKCKVSYKDFIYLNSTHRAISDFERIGDYSENIIEYADSMKDINEKFSNEAIKEIDEVTNKVNQLYELTVLVYESGDKTEFKKAKRIEQDIDDLTKQMSENHIIRMGDGICNANVGAQYLKLASDIERIGDHLININDKEYEISH